MIGGVAFDARLRYMLAEVWVKVTPVINPI